MTSPSNLRALVVDDDADILDFITHVLRGLGCQVATAVDGDRALNQAQCFHPDVVFLDINIPEQDGWLVCSKLKLSPRSPRIVLITGSTRPNTDHFAGFVHADSVLHKPFSDAEVVRELEEVCPAATR